MQTYTAVVMLFLVASLSRAHAQDADIVAPEAERAPEAEPALQAEAALEAYGADVSLQAEDAASVEETPAQRGPSRVDSSAPLSGGERWVKENGQWKLRRINYRYLDHPDYAARPAPPQTIDDFPEPQPGVVLSTRWFGRSGWGWRATPAWGIGWGSGGGWGNGGWGNGWGLFSPSPWSWGLSPWSPRGYGGWRGVPRYGWGNRGWGNRGFGGRGFGARSRFGFSLGWGLGF